MKLNAITILSLARLVLKKSLDQFLTYHPETNMCYARMRFSKLSSSDFEVLAKYAAVGGYDITITAADTDKLTGKNGFIVEVSYSFKEIL